MKDFESTQLRVLLIDKDQKLMELLANIINDFSFVELAKITTPIETVFELDQNKFNVIFIDPLSENLDSSSKLIFRIRQTFPGVVFVLFTDFSFINNNSDYFYFQERKRLLHYYKLNKRTPFFLFEEECLAALQKCQKWLHKRGFANDSNNEKRQNENSKYSEKEIEFENISVEVKKLLSEDRVLEALNELNKFFLDLDSEMQNEIIIQTQKMKNINRNLNISITYEDFLRMKTQITKAILDLINSGNVKKM